MLKLGGKAGDCRGEPGTEGSNGHQSACETGFIANQLYAWRPEFPFGRGLLTPASTHRLCSSGGGEPPGSCNAAIEIGIGGAILGVGASVELSFRGEIIGLLKATTGLCRPVRVRVPIATRSVDLRRGL